MKKGYLSSYFSGVGVKRLTASEVDPEVSNQHEFQGIKSFVQFLGSNRKKDIPTHFIWMDDEDEIHLHSFTTWSDVREKKEDRDPEHRLYYRKEAEEVVYKSQPNDSLIICDINHKELLVLICPQGSSIESQLLWLFGLSKDINQPEIKIYDRNDDKKLSLASKFILEKIGIEIHEIDNNYLDLILKKFKGGFPSTKDFSKFARSTYSNISPINDPDEALVKWIEREELLFKTFEEHLVSKMLEQGFDDVESFISYSLSVQNRRKSRMGYALENHLRKIFNEFDIHFSYNAITENKSRPDFIFPSIENYHGKDYPKQCLTMLGVKSSCKDRWRQVLSEADKINEKHLFTLEPSISENQTEEMKTNNVQLVLPQSIHSTYANSQQDKLLSLAEFIDLVLTKQKKC